MPAKVAYEKDNHEVEHEKIANVHYNVNSQEQKYHNESGHKDVEKRHIVKYHQGAGARSAVGSKISRASGPTPPKRSVSKLCKSKKPAKEDKSCVSQSAQSTTSRSSKTLSAAEIASKCYDRKLGKKRSCTRVPKWQFAEYCRDECGSGVVAKKFDFLGSRKLWCKTPLSLYQATVGELGRKILCREEIVPRDVKPAPPCNIDHDILPMCGGYYRKYDCLRPCEEEHAVVKSGKKQYRNLIDRYWEPCYSKGQKFHLNINDYAPQNAVLMKKFRRSNVDGAWDVPCW